MGKSTKYMYFFFRRGPWPVFVLSQSIIEFAAPTLLIYLINSKGGKFNEWVNNYV